VITAKRLRELFIYNPKTGEFTRRLKMSNRPAGEIVLGTACYSRGRPIGRRTGIDGENYYIHRLAWLYVHGRWPAEQVDHKNGDPLDNRLLNLREANYSQNGANMRRHARSSSGLKGAYSHYRIPGKWVAIICKNRKQKYLGTFDSKEAAHAKYCAEANKLFGEFARTA